MVDVLKDLPPFSWRGVQYPVTARSVEFRQVSVEHSLERRNQDLIEQTGGKNLVFSYTLSMREDLFKGPYSQMFTVGLQRLFADCRNREPGELIDPVQGSIRCVPRLYSDTTDVTKRDGTDVRVEFIESPEEDAETSEDPPTFDEVDADAESAQVDVAEFIEDENFADEFSAAVPDGQNVGDLFQFAEDVLEFPESVANQVIGSISREIMRVNSIYVRAKRLEEFARDIGPNPIAWTVEQTSRRLREKSSTASENNGQIKPVITATTVGAKSVTSLAAEYNVSVSDLLDANPRLASLSTVPSGTNVIIPS